jgi:hypothetical protein
LKEILENIRNNKIRRHKMSVKIGNASYGGVKRNYFKLKDGEAVFRILPPLGDLADAGRWSVFWNVHYGYKNSKGQLRAFQSPLVKNRKTKMIEASDPALDRINALKAEFEKAKASGNKELIAKLDKLVGQKGQYNLDSNHYMNVVDTQGNIGVLKIRHRAKLALDAAIKKLRDKGIDPLSVNDGRFFVFSRSGMGLDTTFQVEVLKKQINVDGIGMVEQDVVHKLDESIIGRLEREAAQLDKLFKRPTSEQVERIVKEGASAVDEILDAKTGSDEGDQGGDEPDTDYDEPTSSAPTQAAAAPVVAAATTTAAPAQASTPAPTVTQPAAAAAAPKAESLATPPKTTAQAVSEQSDEDFLKSLGI